MVATAEKVGKVAPNGRWEGGWVIWAMPELKRFFLVLMASLILLCNNLTPSV